MRMHFILLTLIFFALFLGSPWTQALSPEHSFLKIEDPHFHILFDAKSYEEAKEHLQAARRSHRILSQVFGVSPSYTILILDPDTDLANGAATGIPRPTIFSITHPPTSLSSVNYFSNWTQDVVLHEYAHILNMEPAHGLFRPLRWVFGSLVRPNTFLPRWYLEGLAVEMESRFNPTGRLKSTDYDALIRALYLDEKWGHDSLSQINEVSIPSWPQGQRPYFYGALLWHEIYQKYGHESVRTLNDRYGRRFPYFISAPIEDLSGGLNYSDLLAEVYKKYGALAQEQIQLIQKKPVTRGKRISIKDSLVQHSSIISPDQRKLAFVNVTINGDSEIYILSRKNIHTPFSFNSGARIKSIEKSEIQKISWFPNSQKIAFDAVDTVHRYKSYFDLYTYDLTSQKIEKITRGKRAREPSVSPDGQSLIYVQASASQTQLYSLNLQTQESQNIWTPPRGMRVSRPSHISQNLLVFAQKQESGNDQLRVLDLSTGHIVHELTSFNHSSQPSVSSQGIVFTSHDSGAENLYLTDSTLRSPRPLTNTLTKIINGGLDPASKTLFYSELSGTGIHLKRAPQSTQPSPPRIPHPLKKDFEDMQAESFHTEADSETDSPTATSYSPIRYMFPQYWMPFFNSTEDGIISSISIPGSDALGFHNYLISTEYDSRSKEWSYGVFYGWLNSLGVTKASFFDTATYYPSLKRSTNEQGGRLDQDFYLWGLSNDFQGTLGFNYELNTLPKTSGKDEHHYFKGPSIGFNYSNVSQKLTDIAPYGQSFFVRYTHYLKNTTQSNYDKVSTHLAHHHRLWLPNRHRLAMKVSGVYSEKNRPLLLGTTTSETLMTFGPTLEGFFLRGYPPSEFIGYSMFLGKLEYKFPIADIYSGPNNPFPIFHKRLHGEVFTEALTLKGIYFEKETQKARTTELGKFFASAGVEGKLDMTLFYHVPVTFVIGAGFGFESQAQGELRIYSMLQSPLLFQ